MSRWRKDATDDIVLEYECAMRQIRKVREEARKRRLGRLDRLKPATRLAAEAERYFHENFVW